MKLIWLSLIAALLAGCGSGGGSSVGSTVQPGKVAVELTTQTGSPATVLYGVEFTLRLPAGVTVPADTFSGEIPAGVLHPADGAALAGARFQPATAANRAEIRVNIVDSGGFGVGPLASLNCTVTPGVAVNWSELSVESFSARDSSGADIPGITPHFTTRAL